MALPIKFQFQGNYQNENDLLRICGKPVMRQRSDWNDRKRRSSVNFVNHSKWVPFRIRFAFNGRAKTIDLKRADFEQLCYQQFQVLERMLKAIDLQALKVNRVVFAGSSSRLRWFQSRIGEMGSKILLKSKDS